MPAQRVVDELQLAVLDEERMADVVAAARIEDAFAVAVDLHVARNGPGAPAERRRRIGRDVRDGRVVDVFPAVVRRLGSANPAEELEGAVVERQDAVFLRLSPPRLYQLLELLWQLA